ncbi:Acetyl xylan esterase (AXE1) [Cyclobacterium lianum]|uniref:Acetyl xylan esterase (AXE1) n=1 Tax=Cyclobacterium lianum TaxID=388280 RepID=A0A1M7PEW8_9BACT|nr:acetylxylan esterase [Cyclobacterium lianum]SHN15601.1 Acetyl xylan esterase (AXE1) [Cyclobacterium lianum]
MLRKILLTAMVSVLYLLAAYGQEDLKVIQPHWVSFTDGSNALYKHQTMQAFELLSARKKALQQLDSKASWQEWQAQIRKKLWDAVGPFPEKTPLDAEITRKVQKDGFRMEHLVYQSQPGFYVSATLFVPDGLSEKAPAIIYCSGHALESYRSHTYQHVILNLVKKGFIVFAFDPVGQGERLEYFDPADNKPTIGGPTKQHSYPGAQAFIAGTSQARYMIWDGIRAVDYLTTRREVDASRIGITGRSGGGTQSAYIAAFDERIYASAPENYITNFKRLLLTHGPQDAEQNFYRGIASGLDQPDLLLVRAPKPSLMITTTRDIFNIEGAREAAAEVRRIYDVFDHSERFGMVEDDAGHASTLKNREAMYAFFQENLNYPGIARDEPIDTLSREDLQVTSTGQILSSYPAKTIFELNQEHIPAQSPGSLAERVAKSRMLSGYRDPVGEATTMMTGRFQREGYTVEKHLMRGEGDYWIPFLLMKPDAQTSSAVLFLDPGGKSTDAAAGADMEALVKEGHMVLAPDLLNTGEMGNGGFTGDSNFQGESYNLWFGSILIGRSIVGLHAGDVNRLVRVLQEKQGVSQVRGLAKGQMASVLLHAANYNPDIRSIALINPMNSFRSLVTSQKYDPSQIAYTVAGALPHYDLPDLLENLADRNPLILEERSMDQRTFPEWSESLKDSQVRSIPQSDIGARAAHLRNWLNP